MYGDRATASTARTAPETKPGWSLACLMADATRATVSSGFCAAKSATRSNAAGTTRYLTSASAARGTTRYAATETATAA